MPTAGFTPAITTLPVINAGVPLPVISPAVVRFSMKSPVKGFYSIVVIAGQAGTVTVGIVEVMAVIAAVTKGVSLGVVTVRRPADMMALGVAPESLVISTTVSVVTIWCIKAVVWDGTDVLTATVDFFGRIRFVERYLITGKRLLINGARI